jgi:NAD(P)-dependent dehydrogenase (short-subunit alcohol dehydrogenase family)
VLAFGGVDLVVNNAGLSLSKPLLETTVADWDLQHDVMAKGSFLVSREAARGDDRPEPGRRHRLHLVEELGVRRAQQHRLLGRPRPDQAHSGPAAGRGAGVATASGSTGSNPDGVVRGSGIFAGGWGAKRAEVYGVKGRGLGAYYARRTLLGREVLP